MNEFAKIILSSDGHQVLFYKTRDDQGPCLRQVTEYEGAYAELNFGFKDKDSGWDALDLAFNALTTASADAVRNIIRKSMQ